MIGHNSVMMEIQTAMKGWQLSTNKYTAFIDFNRKKCGAPFIRAVAEGQVEINIFDRLNNKIQG